ncbi:MAG: PDZ domain-containing protein [Bacteroidales bacterium]|nr:PDZ domain-containing protein [Bacteroidales bacterium]
MKHKRKISIIIVGFVLISSLTIGFVRNDFEIAKNLDIYATLLQQLNEHYVDGFNAGELVEESIHAMLNKLDPYTVYYPESQIEEFKLLTTGQYGGIGALILQDDDYVLISEPYEGTPAFKAGLQAGDKIIKVNGVDAKGKTVSDVSSILKGQPGTNVSLEILPYGKKNTINKNIIREEIKLPNISYSGKVSDDIGYIHLSQFTENAAADVKAAFLKLKSQGINSLIIDLRANGGGLLNEAVELVNLFVPKGELIVSTKGKMSNKNQMYYTRNEPIDVNIPLVVLVDEYSASASEIVAGAIQDLDRGLVVGRRTFGKGLVQNVVPLSYNTRLKVTVSKYYIPSGRCIQKYDYADKDIKGSSKEKSDSIATAFKTKNGRIVYDYGGVEPDIKIPAEEYSTILATMLENKVIFNYANDYKLKHNQLSSIKDFSITDAIYNDFTTYFSSQEVSYETYTEKQLKALEKSAEDDRYAEAIKEDINQLKQHIKKEKSKDLQRFRKEIEKLLYLEIVSRYYYQKGRIEAALYDDPQVEKVKKLLQNKEEYTKILSTQK